MVLSEGLKLGSPFSIVGFFVLIYIWEGPLQPGGNGWESLGGSPPVRPVYQSLNA